MFLVTSGQRDQQLKLKHQSKVQGTKTNSFFFFFLCEQTKFKLKTKLKLVICFNILNELSKRI